MRVLILKGEGAVLGGLSGPLLQRTAVLPTNQCHITHAIPEHLRDECCVYNAIQIFCFTVLMSLTLLSFILMVIYLEQGADDLLLLSHHFLLR